jgi:hypothetical protein
MVHPRLKNQRIFIFPALALAGAALIQTNGVKVPGNKLSNNKSKEAHR